MTLSELLDFTTTAWVIAEKKTRFEPPADFRRWFFGMFEDMAVQKGFFCDFPDCTNPNHKHKRND